jgi:hypothetical protein
MGYDHLIINETIEPKKIKLKLRSLKKIQNNQPKIENNQQIHRTQKKQQNQDTSNEIFGNHESFEIIQHKPQVKLKENVQYDLKNISLSYFEDKFQLNLHFGDIVQLSEYKAADSYIVSKDRKLIYLPQFDGSFHLRIPFEITKHIQDSVSIFQNIHPYLTHIYLRHDDKFIQEHIGVLDELWDGKIAWLNPKYFDENIEVEKGKEFFCLNFHKNDNYLKFFN